MWQRCADWLIRLSVLPANHVVVGSSGTLQDLAYTLRDGVVLCHVALALDPQVSQILTLAPTYTYTKIVVPNERYGSYPSIDTS